MTRHRQPPTVLLTALCLVAQGALLLAAGRGAEAPGLRWPLLVGLLGVAVAMLAAVELRRRRGIGSALVVAAEVVLIGILLLAGGWTVEDPARWREATLERLGAALDREQAILERVATELDGLAAPAADSVLRADPFAGVEELAVRWQDLFPAADRYPVGVALWAGGERLAWDRRAAALPAPVPPVSGGPPTGGLVRRGDRWFWRHLTPLPAGSGPARLLELQMPVPDRAYPAGTATGPGGGAVDWQLPGFRIEVVAAPAGVPAGPFGDPDGGLRLVRDLHLGAGPAGPAEPHLRLVARSWPLRWEQDRMAARRLTVLVLLWILAAAGWGWAAMGAAGLIAGLWLGRGLLVGLDFFRWLQMAMGGQRLPALPAEPASLIDPAYFATPWGGWFASAADTLLTALLFAATARLVLGWLAPRARPPTAGREPGRLARWRPALFALLAAGALLLLRGAVAEVVENANPRLIGPRIPVRSLTFWALHLVLLLGAGSILGLVMGLAARWRGGRNRWGSLAAVLAVALALALLAPGLTWPVRSALPVVVAVAWWVAPLGLVPDAPWRWVHLAVPFLLLVGWNYAGLAEAYGRSERAWLERKADQLVLPQEDWIQFLLEDVLVELTGPDRDRPAGSIDPGLGAELWRNRLAFDLWRRSAVRDLGVPCLLEVLDADGYTISLFASGFLRDFGYEVRTRTEWRAGRTVPGAALPYVQGELRRYPTGEERILRGEIPRRDGAGWVRLELPVQSKRISTLLARLRGDQTEPEVEAYRPRAEVDRPVVLLRGDDSGWLDAGPGGFPAGRSDRVIRTLREGERRWGRIRVGPDRFLCLWRPLPDDRAASPGEGFLLGLQLPGAIDLLLDLSRLLLLDLLLLAGLAGAGLLVRLGRGQRTGLRPGFQERFLAAYLALGLLLLLMAGMAVDRLSLERIESGARHQTRDGLASALGQLQGLLAEQARALAESDYIGDLLANRLAGQRPLGPFSVRQAMVFTGDGRLLLDETLSDLDDRQAATLLAAAREAPLVVMDEESEVFLGTVIPIDLSAVMPPAAAAPDSEVGPDLAGAPADETAGGGFFLYRQRADGDLVAGLGEVVQGEITLRVGGETVLASHPERLFSGRTPLMAPPAMMGSLLRRPGNPLLYATPDTRLSFTGCVGLPSLSLPRDGAGLHRRAVPAVLAMSFPAREREFVAQREATVLFLAGLATLILVTAALMAFLMTWNIFGPVRILVNATRRLAGGDFDAPLPEGGRDEVGTLATSFGSMRDELRRARDRLAERERFLTTVLDRVPVGVAVFGEEGRVVVLNPAGVEILAGFYREEAGGGGAAGRLLAGFGGRADAAAPADLELVSEDGKRTLRGRQAPLTLPDGRRDTMIVFEDVTEFLRNKRLALNAELARQVAHEIKNPLTPIQLSIQLLDQAYHDRAPDLDRIVTDTVDRVLEQVTLLRAIATEFSLLGRPDDLECERVDLAAVVARVVSGYRTAGDGDAGPRIEIEPAQVPPVRAHAESLVKVLGNLMENSIDASGGFRRLRLQIGWRITADEVTLIWRDAGSGLAPDVAERLFDPYFSTKSMGTGLGLAICLNLLDKMDGAITLANRQDGPGAVAEVTLPRFPE